MIYCAVIAFHLLFILNFVFFCLDPRKKINVYPYNNFYFLNENRIAILNFCEKIEIEIKFKSVIKNTKWQAKRNIIQ